METMPEDKTVECDNIRLQEIRVMGNNYEIPLFNNSIKEYNDENTFQIDAKWIAIA